MGEPGVCIRRLQGHDRPSALTALSLPECWPDPCGNKVPNTMLKKGLTKSAGKAMVGTKLSGSGSSRSLYLVRGPVHAHEHCLLKTPSAPARVSKRVRALFLWPLARGAPAALPPASRAPTTSEGGRSRCRGHKRQPPYLPRHRARAPRPTAAGLPPARGILVGRAAGAVLGCISGGLLYFLLRERSGTCPGPNC